MTLEATPRPPSRVPSGFSSVGCVAATGLGASAAASCSRTSTSRRRRSGGGGDGVGVSRVGIGTSGEASIVREHFSVPRPLHTRHENDTSIATSVRAATPLLHTTTSRASEQVVLFCVHPHALVAPLQNRVNAKIKAIREWLLTELQKYNLYPNQAIVRLEKQHWYHRLFDVVALSQVINIFQHYLCQCDALAIPQSYGIVYDAYSSEMNRTCSDSAHRDNAHALAAVQGACIMGGIDFTETTLLSTRRSVQVEASAPSFTLQRFGTKTCGGGGGGGATITTAVDRIALVRSCITNQDNVRLLKSFIPRLVQRRQQLANILEQKQREVEAQRQQVLASQRKLAIDALLFTNQRLQLKATQFAQVLKMIHDAQASFRLSRARDAIAQDVQAIVKYANVNL